MNKLEELNKQAEILQKKIEKVKKVANKKPVEHDTFVEVMEQWDLPPYALSFATFFNLGLAPIAEVYCELEDRETNKVATVAATSLIAALSLPLAIVTTPFIAAVESIKSLPQLISITAETSINKSRNNNIKRAKTTLKTLEQQLETVNAEIKELSTEECVN